jgi:peroxiredoxin
MKILIAALVLATPLAASGAADVPDASAPLAGSPIDIGPPVGRPAPPMHALGVDGKPVSLRELSGRRGLVLLFFRSAKWCPYCQQRLTDFRAAQAPLEARGYRLAAISYDPGSVLSAFAATRQIGYTLISDPGSVTIDTYRLRDPQYKEGSFAYGVPKPAIFIISRRGVVQAKLALEGYKVRPTVQSVLDAVDNLSTDAKGDQR